jgi:hypothetical protein
MVFVFAHTRKLAAVLLVAGGALLSNPTPSPGSDEGVLNVDFANGIKATVYSPDYLANRTTYEGTRGTIDLQDGFYLNVVTDIDDPLIVNKGDGRFYPFSPDQVIDLMRDIDYPRMHLRVDIFVLPFPRTDVLVSSTSGRQIFLSPQVREVANETAAYIVAHEMGHVFQGQYMPTSSHRRWSEYRQLRDIEDVETYNATATHANRPAEIFAEDFRVLHGGPLAYFEGRVENPNLPPPAMVPGLYGFFAQLALSDPDQPFIVSVASYPNPFNPRTELSVVLSQAFFDTGELLSVRIYNVRGALVRELYADRPNDLEVRVQWDGRDGQGRQVASSTYFGVVEAGKAKVAQKLLMVK